MLSLCHKNMCGIKLRIGVLLELLAKDGIVVDETTLDSDLKFLQELEVLDRIGDWNT